MRTISIAIADAHSLARLGLRHLLSAMPDFKVVAESVNEQHLLAVVRDFMPDVVTLDYQQPGYFSIGTIRQIRKLSPHSNILVLSADEDKKNIYQVLEEGVGGFLTKQCGEQEIVNALRATADGEKFYCTSIVNHLLEKSFSKREGSPAVLSSRETEIVRLAASGLIAKEIADQLNLSTHTVYTHRKNIMKKLNIGSASELVRYAISEGII
jgi:DNA-binding NarL/FixJ family response regulator